MYYVKVCTYNFYTHLSQSIVCTILVEPILPANCTAGHVRLIGGSTPNKGRLEICISDVWTSVCPSFGSEETGIVCEQLGYLRAGVYIKIVIQLVESLKCDILTPPTIKTLCS